MRHTAFVPLAALVAAAAIVGCGATQTATTISAVTPAPLPSAACSLPSGTTQVVLVYPPPGASPGPSSSPVVTQTVPPSPLPTNSLGGYDVIVAAAPNPLPSTWGTYVLGIQAPTTPAFGGLFSPAPSPFPSGYVDPGLADETFQDSQGAGVFAPVNSWVVYVSNPSCYPGIAVGAFGS
jgi:hypothetical protein